jgi:hypothetical protein
MVCATMEIIRPTNRAQLVPDADISCPMPAIPTNLSEGYAFAFFISMAKLYTKAHEGLFTVRARSAPVFTQIATVDGIIEDLDRWADTLPAEIRPGKAISTNHISGANCPVYIVVILQMLYLNLKIALARLALQVDESADEPMNRHRMVMWQCSRDVFECTRYLDLKPCSPLW